MDTDALLTASPDDRTICPLLEERHGPVLLLTFNRPAARNAISPEMACRLADALEAAEADDAIHAVVLTGVGDRAFCAGGDLARTLPLLTGARPPQDVWDRRLLHDPGLFARSALREIPFEKPILSAVNGDCLAGGMETMLATDIRIAAPHARFGLPEVKRALIPFAGSLVRLPRQVAWCHAMEIMLLGDSITAQDALRMGLVNQIVPAADVLPRTLELATRIAGNGPAAVRAIKRTVRDTSGLPLADAYLIEDAAKEAILATEDAREGPRAFMEKRRPRFTGR